MTEPSGVPGDSLFEVTLPPRPYPGLRPFEKHEWPIFFGRERMADAVVSDIVRKKMLVIHGDSGCGKSSLVRAAVLPRLEQENARGGIEWRTCATAPGESPLWNLSKDVALLVSGRPDEETAIEVRRVMNFGRAAPARLAELLGAGADRQVCLLIDQFEELFDHARHHGPDEASLLTAFCSSLAADPPDGLNVILTMRSEFLGACARFDDFALTVNATQYLLPRMQHEDLLRAIREPARLFGGEVSRALAERLVVDAGGGQDELPLIQHGLMLLHRTHAGADGVPWRLDVEHFGQRGLKALLSDHADAVMADVERTLPAVEGPSRLVEDVFRALTDINADGQAIRRPRTLRQLTAITGGTDAAVRQVVDAFRAEGVSFLRPYGDVPIEPDDRVDISHEALIRRWTKIADGKDGWLVREFRNGLVWRALLVQSDSFERDATNVLGPTTTDERERWLQRRTPEWAERYGGGWPRVQALVDASVAARDRQRAESAAARTREQQARLHEQRLKLFLKGSAVVLLLLIAAVYFAIQSRRAAADAQRAARDAQVEFAKASAARDRSEELAAESDARADEARESVVRLSKALEELRAAGANGPISGQTARAVAQQIEDVAKTLGTTDTKATPAPALGPRVYLHITDERFRQQAADFKRVLEMLSIDGARIIVPGIELVKSAPNRPAMRCFEADECRTDAPKVLAAANSLLSQPTLVLQDLSARYGGSASLRPRHYEIWFTEGLTLRSRSRS